MANIPTPDTEGLPPLIPEAESAISSLKAGMQQSAAPAPEAHDDSVVNVVDPNGQLIGIAKHQMSDALNQGYRVAGDADVAAHIRHEKYGSGFQQAIAGAEGAAQGLAGPIATAAERLAGVPAEDISGRAEENPGTHFGGVTAGLVGPALLTAGTSVAARLGVAGAAEASTALNAAQAFTQAGALEKLGTSAIQKLGLEAASTAPVLMKVGSAAAKGMIENAAFQVGDEASQAILNDPNTASSAIAHVGLAAVIGGGLGAAFGSVHPLWEAAEGSKLGQTLKAVTSRLGGVEGASSNSVVEDALQRTGLADEIAPEIRATVSTKDPHIRELASVLEQTDSNSSGKAFQEAAGNFRNRVAEVQSEALGKPLSDIRSKGEIDKYTSGRQIGETLANEIGSQVDPLVKKYEDFSTKFAGRDLEPTIGEKASSEIQDKAFGNLQKAQRDLQNAMKSNSPDIAAASAKVDDAQAALTKAKEYSQSPGTTDKIAQDIMARARSEGWTDSPSSDVMKEVERVQKELPNIKTLKQLSNYIKQVGENTASKDPFGRATPVSRAGGIMKSVMRDAEAELIGSHIGSEEGAHVLEQYQATRKAYAEVSQLKDLVDDRLGVHGSTSGFAKGIRAMAKEDGEGILRKLSGKNDAAWLDLVAKRFPNTAELIKSHHVESLLAAAKDGDSISSAKLIKGLEGMSPQLRSFAVPQEALAKVNAAHSLLEALNDSTHNYSNTARTLEKLTQNMPGTVAGMIAALTGHNILASALIGGVTKTIGKDAPDAVRLALLKFLGTAKPVESGGFKAAVDFFHAAIKGENAMTNGVKSLFKGVSKVLPDSMLPTEKDRVKLDKALSKVRDKPDDLLHVGGNVGSYLPDHSSAIAQTASSAAQFLNSLRPSTAPSAPMDSKTVPSAVQKAAYNQALNIAQQPLIVLNKIKDGSLLPQDVVALKTMYPSLYGELAKKINNELVSVSSKGQSVPYKTRMSLSLFMGQALDSTMTPESIIAAQPVPKAPSMPQDAQQPKHSTSALNKLPNAYQTASQAAEQHRTKGGA